MLVELPTVNGPPLILSVPAPASEPTVAEWPQPRSTVAPLAMVRAVLEERTLLAPKSSVPELTVVAPV